MRTVFFLASVMAAATALANDVDPFGFEKEVAASTLTRAEVRAKIRLAEPVTMKIDDQGRLITAPSTRTRVEVVAEAREFARLGQHRFGDLGPTELTEQEQALRMAVTRADSGAATTH